MFCSTFWLLCLVFDFECLGRSEFFMVAPDNLTHEKFFAKSKSEQADLVLLPHFKKLMLSSSWLRLRCLCFCFLTFTSSQANRLNPHWHLLSARPPCPKVWQGLFVERTPISEACQGVVTTLYRHTRWVELLVRRNVESWCGLEFIWIQLQCDHSLALYVVIFVDMKLRTSRPVFNHSVTSLLRLGLEKFVAERDLKSIRAWFGNQSLDMGVGGWGWLGNVRASAQSWSQIYGFFFAVVEGGTVCSGLHH